MVTLMLLQHAFIWNKQCDNVNQILLTTFFAVTYFHDQDKDYLDNNLPEKLDDWVMVRNICTDDSSLNFVTSNGYKSWFTVIIQTMWC